MNTALFRFLFHSLILPIAIAALIALACGTFAFCDEIHDAAIAGDLAKVKALLKENPKLVLRRNAYGDTPLHYAVEKSDRDVVELLLANKADVNARNTSGWTPLHRAAMLGNKGVKDVMESLLAYKADINARDNSGETPLLYAAHAGHKEVIEFLLANKADVNAKVKNGETSLHYAAERGDSDAVELLLVNKADANAKGINAEETPLHLAAWNGRTDAAKLLLANKADINAKDNRGETPLHLAALEGHKDVVEFLLANKADVNAKNNDGYTPLQLAAQKGYKEVVELLSRHGGSVDSYTQGKLPVLHPSGDYWERGNKKVKVEIANCAHNRKFALVGDDSLYMLDDQNNTLWSWVGPPITCMPIMDSKGTVYLLAEDITWVALDSSNGKEKWRRRFEFMGSVVYSQTKMYKDDMYFVVWDMSGYREKIGLENNILELCKGDLSLWSTEIPAYSTIQVENGKVFNLYKRHGQMVKHEVAIPKVFPKGESIAEKEMQ
jgi:ankyrin repeat protein